MLCCCCCFSISFFFSKTNEVLCENNMQILKLLSEEVFDFSKDQMTTAKIKTMKESLNDVSETKSSGEGGAEYTSIRRLPSKPFGLFGLMLAASGQHLRNFSQEIHSLPACLAWELLLWAHREEKGGVFPQKRMVIVTTLIGPRPVAGTGTRCDVMQHRRGPCCLCCRCRCRLELVVVVVVAFFPCSRSCMSFAGAPQIPTLAVCLISISALLPLPHPSLPRNSPKFTSCASSSWTAARSRLC